MYTLCMHDTPLIDYHVLVPRTLNLQNHDLSEASMLFMHTSQFVSLTLALLAAM